jgi:hypothetical protein
LLNLVNSTWNFAYAVNWLLSDENGSQEGYVLVLAIVLGLRSHGISLIVSFFVAARSGPKGGVWSGMRGRKDEAHY